ncbi:MULTISPECIES: glycoside hydrolase family 65 protein [unclassified Arthrobacter]|uniref:glycoside hydrolase family 65 protein n=1 Tax=unclassified Arthrobacter TaxID=235627 RepID=UPI00159D8D24|nr:MULTISPECIES: glycoside hydrolase family 65 protein [unclassified Arthrobacter]MCQ9163798.1 glycoside hydrolase family 65 protein [Arthrobacter sp. STN4]NVM99417.1 glycoside hydrolase family 65 protein [Arthrobacter sp. SDTb3-6]
MALISSDRQRFPCDPWRLVETASSPDDAGTMETLMALGNGHLGIRGSFSFGGPGKLPGTFINGFYETWEIKHAENAYGFARTGQRIVYVPEASGFTVTIDGEQLLLAESTVLDYRRSIDFSTGIHEGTATWATRSGATVNTTVRRAVGFTGRGLLGIELDITADRDVYVDVVSTVVNRQDLPVSEESFSDPRRPGRHADRILQPLHLEGADGAFSLAWETATSHQRVAVAVAHETNADEQPFETVVAADESSVRYVLAVEGGRTFRLAKSVSYAVAGESQEEDRGEALAAQAGAALADVDAIFADSAAHYRHYWDVADIVVGGEPQLQQAVRWNLFQLAQATARAGVSGIPAKGVTGAGYEGHYFWDQEIYLLPYLTYTNPHAARQVLESRHQMLPTARRRAAELSVDGALFAWRTINGLEASAYYAAGTAQFHIAAAIAFAANRYGWATGDPTFQGEIGADLLVETARMWASLGFFGKDGMFHIHGVTGPDEYTAVVNDNLYTNVMARFNLRKAAAAQGRPDVTERERQLWQQAADRMCLPYDSHLQVYSQDADFMTLEPWDWTTPKDKYPLLLHFHPLVIYRHQVLKQADTVLAMFLQWQDFTAEEKQRAFDFYDPITTGDSTLSACVQGIMAAEVGYGHTALKHFTEAVFIDLDNTHANTVDGVHIASAGGIWSSLVCGFAGMRDQGEMFHFDPRLPEGWDSLSFKLTVRGALLAVSLVADAITFSLQDGPDVEPLAVDVRGTTVRLTPGDDVKVALQPVPPATPAVFPGSFPTTGIPIIGKGLS